MIGLAVLLGIVYGLWRLRRSRKRTLAGLNPVAPTFSVAPPVRSLLSRKDHRL